MFITNHSNLKPYVAYVRKAISGDLKQEFLEAPNEGAAYDAARILCDGEVENIKPLTLFEGNNQYIEWETKAVYQVQPADFLTFGL